MTKLPTRDTLGERSPSIPRDRRLATFDESAIGEGQLAVARGTRALAAGYQDKARGVASFGKAAESVSKVADAFAEAESRRNKFEAERRYQEFAFEQTQRLHNSMAGLESGQAESFVGSFQESYMQSARELFSSIAPEHKSAYEAKLMDLELRLGTRAAEFARDEISRAAENSIIDTTQQVHIPEARAVGTAALPDIIAKNHELVQSSPYGTPARRDALARDTARDIAKAHVDELAQNDPSAVIEMLSPGGEVPEGLQWLEDADRQQAIRAAESVLDGRRQEYVNQLEDDVIPYLRQGGTLEREITLEELTASVGEDAATELVAEIREAKEFGAKVNAIRFAPPEQINAMLEEARPVGPEDFGDRSRDYKLLEQAVANRADALEKDPARYALQHENVRAQYNTMAGALENQELSLPAQQQAVTRYVNETLALQEKLGLPEYERRILPAGAVSTIAARFDHQPEGGQNAAVQIQNLAEQWGRHWPRVLGELQAELPAPIAVIGTMLRPEQLRAAEDLAEAATVGLAEFKKMPTYSSLQHDALEEAVAGELLEFAGTVMHQSQAGIQRTISAFHESVHLLGYVYLGRGESPEAAARQAYDDIVSKAYTIEDTYRVPIDVNAGLVRDGTIEIMQGLETQDIDTSAALFGLTDEQTRTAYLNTLRARGRFVTAPDESGLMLIDEQQAVVTADGEPIVFKWRDLTSQAGTTFSGTFGRDLGATPLGQRIRGTAP